jgi:hypothetical protein
MTCQIKIVPNTDPNADGEWIDIPIDVSDVRGWRNVASAVDPHVPEGFHVVAVDCNRVSRERLSVVKP